MLVLTDLAGLCAGLTIQEIHAAVRRSLASSCAAAKVSAKDLASQLRHARKTAPHVAAVPRSVDPVPWNAVGGLADVKVQEQTTVCDLCVFLTCHVDHRRLLDERTSVRSRG